MKYITFGIFLLMSIISNGQCKKETKVQYYDSTYKSYSESYNVTVEFGKGSEISNNYNYLNYESNDLYCIIYGFDKKYEVKLFTNYSSIYKTNCSSISNIFTSGYIKGKDQDGRIWKIRNSSSESYSDDIYTRSRKYNKPTSNINHKYIASTLKTMQAKIDYNKKLVGETFESFSSRKTDLFKEISNSNIPKDKKERLYNKYKVLIDNKIDNCSNLADFESLEGTLTLINCLNLVHSILDNLEYEINNYILKSDTKKINKKTGRINLDKLLFVDYSITNTHLVLSIKGYNSASVQIDVNNNNKIDANFDRYYNVTQDRNICSGYLISKSTNSTCGKAKSEAIVKNYSDSRTYEIPLSEINNNIIGLIFSYYDGKKHTYFPNNGNFNNAYKIEIY